MPNISIITPSHNQGKYIDECINSIFNNELPDKQIEYFVYDACSTDSTIKNLSKYKYIDWHSEPDNGQSHAINKGLKKATAPILGYLNSDDTLEPGALDYVCNYFDNNPEVDLLFGEAHYINDKSEITGRYLTRSWDPYRFLGECFICQPAAFFSKRIFEKIGYFSEDLRCSMDYDYWIRILNAGGVIHQTDKVLANFRIYPEIKSFAERDTVFFENYKLLKRNTGYCHANWFMSHITHYLRNKPKSVVTKILPKSLENRHRLSRLLETISKL